ncbi:unnamed protein product [Absidia cylindrospora]
MFFYSVCVMIKDGILSHPNIPSRSHPIPLSHGTNFWSPVPSQSHPRPHFSIPSHPIPLSQAFLLLIMPSHPNPIPNIIIPCPMGQDFLALSHPNPIPNFAIPSHPIPLSQLPSLVMIHITYSNNQMSSRYFLFIEFPIS